MALRRKRLSDPSVTDDATSSGGTTTTTSRPGELAGGGDSASDFSSPEIHLRKKSSPLDVDRQIAQELNNLTLEERSRNFESIHGVEKLQEETEDLVESCITRMEASLACIPKKAAYDRAEFLRPGLLKDRDFQLCFLRADSYNPVKAADRMVAYFEAKLSLFGEDKLVRKLSWYDLTPEEQWSLNAGSIQLTPSMRDNSGRLVYVVNCKYHDHDDNITSSIRLTWYVFSSVLMEDPDAQRRGLVIINFLNGKLRPFQSTTSRKGEILSKAFPIRIAGLHYCSDDKVTMHTLKSMLKDASKEARLRQRSHFGTYEQCFDSLASFGMPESIMPIDREGHPRTQAWKLFLSQVKASEASHPANEGPNGEILYPLRNDILLGRGFPYQNFHGNQLFSELIDRYVEEYKSAEYCNKGKICVRIVAEVHETLGARFLQRMENPLDGWEEVSPNEAKSKVGHTLRSKLKKIRKGAQKTLVDDDFASPFDSTGVGMDPNHLA